MDNKTRKFLMTIRAALIMATKAIDLYLRDEPEAVTVNTDNASISQI